MTAETDIAAIDDGGANTAGEVRTAMTSSLTPEWMRYLYQRQSDETAHNDDDFFDDGTVGGTAVTPSGTPVWTESRGILSVKCTDLSSNDVAARAFALSGGATSSPVTVETCLALWTGTASAAPRVGLAFSDGTSATSNIAGGFVIQSQLNTSAGTFTNVTGEVNQANTGQASHAAWIYMRVVWESANTFQTQWSFDGVTYTDFGGGSLTRTMTPTHFAVMASDWGFTEDVIGSFQYVRVYESDLSV